MRDKYGPKGYWIWNCLRDIIIAGCCLAGFAVAIEKNPSPKVEPQYKKGIDALMWMSLIIG